MKINAKFKLWLSTERQAIYTCTIKQPVWYGGYESFYSINFHPMGKPEACIYCVIEAEA